MKKLPGSTTLAEARKAGRMGDEHLVHLNSAEVGMLENMTNGHGLTINPQTGEKEAFLPFLMAMLPSMFPAIGTALAGAGLPAMLANPLALSAIGSGLGTFAETGDLGKGLQAGVMGAALGGLGGKLMSGLTGGAGAVAGKAAQEGAKAAMGSAASAAMPSAAMAASGMSTPMAEMLPTVNPLGIAPAAPGAGLGSMLNAGMVGMPGEMMVAGNQQRGSTEAERKRKERIARAEMENFPDPRVVNTAPAGYRHGFDPEFDFFSPQGYADGGLIQSLSAFSPLAAMMSGDMGALRYLSPLAMLDYNKPGTPESRAAEKKKKGFAEGGPVMGPGHGTSDSIPATINGSEPAALSDGEYVIPAMAVAALGNGSSKAGQQELDKMVQSLLDSITNR